MITSVQFTAKTNALLARQISISVIKTHIVHLTMHFFFKSLLKRIQFLENPFMNEFKCMLRKENYD